MMTAQVQKCPLEPLSFRFEVGDRLSPDESPLLGAIDHQQAMGVLPEERSYNHLVGEQLQFHFLLFFDGLLQQANARQASIELRHVVYAPIYIL